MASTRRLAAVLAADVAGYSRLMGADEEGTHERLNAQRRELAEPKIGELPAASSKRPATACWRNSRAEIQSAMADRDLDLAEERRLRFRIGINLGDIISTAMTFRATPSTSRRGWRGWRHRAASASRAPFAIISRPAPLRLRRYGRAERQEHRSAGAGLCGAP
jgi:hypothetical protein